ncbi:GatB/YqeY domain-containing protein [Cryptosporangium phraense]|uniref:GatB/YqeY domain-containing protein n=1 Tax=Cryptosporangium phraense TaxID=2593070 RepID=A0A545AR89_9ACTN|nr:GatB/YqeY domain-containing protein [Cryptosporangium phraense]TQS43793.1 GatB/YqeY domain-containing protein [Cryptosporangium phraense]
MSTTEGGLKTRLTTDLTTAMKSRDELVTATLRMALTAIRNEEVAGKAARELSDDEVLRVLTREAKKRTEAAEAFASGGRADRADRERAEGEVLSRYLPKQLSDDELTAVVASALSDAGVTDVKQMGQAMKAVQAAVAGRAPGGRVAAEVKRQLS